MISSPRCLASVLRRAGPRHLARPTEAIASAQPRLEAGADAVGSQVQRQNCVKTPFLEHFDLANH